jgi:group II intron reverse transcriptase/maturase
MNLWDETKSIPISHQIIWQAYKKVRSNKGSAGIDEISMQEFDANREKNLYKLWNRMASGSYFPPPVKEVEIPKKDGTKRKLGIPTINDRIGQMVIKILIEPRLEKVFNSNSFGYRPNRSAHDALSKVRKNCWKKAWVIDLDIKGFFDNIDHEKLMLALKKHVSESWILLYIKRWLEAPIITKSGELIIKQNIGTPQGGVISPLLANLFLHYALDEWLLRTDKNVDFTRYADDVILHCDTKVHAEQVLELVQKRMHSVGLQLHPEKTKLVYCKNKHRRGNHPIVKFDFLGYTFQPRTSYSKKNRRMFLGFDCAISISSRKRIAEKLKTQNLRQLHLRNIVGVAQYLNPLIRGWVHYYGKFKMYELTKVFTLLSWRLVSWARKRYKRYKTNFKKSFNWLKRVKVQYPALFYHWNFNEIKSIA